MIEGLKRALIVGGGIGGMASAIRLRQLGVEVDLIDLDPEWRVYGAGITITGPTLRAYKRLGLLDKIRAEGAITNGTRLFHFSGAPIMELDEPAIEEGLPATGGILRPVLHRIMSEEVRRLDVSVKLGVSVESLNQSDGSVLVHLTDDTDARYDLVIGADGISSKVRSLVFPNAVQAKYTGQGSWRILTARPKDFDKGEIYLGHSNLVGITACSPEHVYVFMLNAAPDKTWIKAEDQPDKVRDLLADFGGRIKEIRESVRPDSSIVFRPLESALQPKPWNIGHVVLLGDAAHATTPHLASGAGMAVEDALVLSDELERHAPDIDAALNAFTERRFDRCRFVVETSVAIGAAQLAGTNPQEVGAMTGQALHKLAEDI